MGKNTFNVDKNIITNLRDFVNICLKFGLDIKIEEGDYEPCKINYI